MTATPPPAAEEAGPGAITFPAVDRPVVSIVMVTYGGWEWARRALRGIADNTDPCYEVVIVDNASPPEVRAALAEQVAGAKVVFNQRNVGFGGGVNLGALHAVGRYLCLLNSDTIVRPGWLPPLLESFERDESVGAAVPCFLNLDGTLQEAGSVVGGDGTTLSIGDGMDPRDPSYRFRRRVDFGSAACLLIPRALFAELGGFDPAYGLGYCEDVDLCLALAERGLRTVYEPRAEVVHVRWGSGTREDAVRLVRANTLILESRWRHRLEHRPSLDALETLPHRVMAARDAGSPVRVLVVCGRVPRDAWGSPDRRMARIVAEAARLWPEVRFTLASPAVELSDPATASLLDLGVECAGVRAGDEAWFHRRLYHYSAVAVGDLEVLRLFRPVLDRTQPQARRLLVRPGMPLGVAGGVAHPGAGVGPWPAEAGDAGWADLVMAASEEEARLWATFAPGAAIRVAPDFVPEAGDTPRFDEREGVVYALTSATATEAVEELGRLRDDLAALWDAEALTVRAISPVPVPEVPEGIEVVVVDGDPSPLLAQARVLLAGAPIDSGRGPGLLVCAASGLPFVTPAFSEGWEEFEEIRRLVTGREPGALAARVRMLHERPEAWERVRSALGAAVRVRFSHAAFRRGLVEMLAQLGLAPPGSATLDGGDRSR